MNQAYPLAASAAAILVVVIGGGILINRPTDQTGTVAASASPTDSPMASTSVAPSPSTSASLDEPVPVSLIGRWMGGSRPSVGIDPPSGSSLSFSARGSSITPPA